MKIVISPDKFKGSLTANQAATTIKRAVLSLYPKADIITLPLSDGGEGFSEMFHDNQSKIVNCNSFDALMRKIESYFIVTTDNFVVIELSEICGLMMLKKEEYNPEKTTTFGLGIIINHAISLGYRNFIIGIGGSATNDCGIGMLAALGAKFYDLNDNIVTPIGENLSKITHIDTIDLDRNISNCSFTVACDVSNTLYGVNGAAYIYAAQKGADKEMIKRLDYGLRMFSEVVKKEKGIDINSIISGGAAGGIGAAFSCFLSSKIVSGSTLITEMLNLKEHISSADLVISAEGKIDSQSFNGKVIGKVCSLSKDSNTPIILLCGVIDKEVSHEMLTKNGVNSCFSIIEKTSSQELAMKEAEFFLEEITKESLIKFYYSN